MGREEDFKAVEEVATRFAGLIRTRNRNRALYIRLRRERLEREELEREAYLQQQIDEAEEGVDDGADRAHDVHWVEPEPRDPGVSHSGP